MATAYETLGIAPDAIGYTCAAMIVYIAYPTSLTLQSANALQTYTTLRELRARRQRDPGGRGGARLPTDADAIAGGAAGGTPRAPQGGAAQPALERREVLAGQVGSAGDSGNWERRFAH